MPAYAINSILGNIPLLGDLLQGGPGEGLFSAAYKISGDLPEPKIDVNPWTALAPGFLRDIFTQDIDEGGDDAPLPKVRKRQPQIADAISRARPRASSCRTTASPRHRN